MNKAPEIFNSRSNSNIYIFIYEELDGVYLGVYNKMEPKKKGWEGIGGRGAFLTLAVFHTVSLMDPSLF